MSLIKIPTSVIVLVVSCMACLADDDGFGDWTEVTKGIDWRVAKDKVSVEGNQQFRYQFRSRFKTPVVVKFEIEYTKANGDGGKVKSEHPFEPDQVRGDFIFCRSIDGARVTGVRDPKVEKRKEEERREREERKKEEERQRKDRAEQDQKKKAEEREKKETAGQERIAQEQKRKDEEQARRKSEQEEQQKKKDLIATQQAAQVEALRKQQETARKNEQIRKAAEDARRRAVIGAATAKVEQYNAVTNAANAIGNMILDSSRQRSAELTQRRAMAREEHQARQRAFENNVTPEGEAMAGSFYSPDGIKRMRDKGLSLDLAARSGETALHRAAGSGNIPSARYLLENGANPNLQAGSGETCLKSPTRNGDIPMVLLLLSHGASPFIADSRGLEWTPEKDAKNDGIYRELMELYSHVKRPNKRIEECLSRMTPSSEATRQLAHACRDWERDKVAALLDKGSDVNAADDFSWTPLMHAAEAGKLDTVNLLLERGAQTDAKNAFGSTALLLAARQGKMDVALFLLEKGADKSIKDVLGTSLDAVTKVPLYNNETGVQFGKEEKVDPNWISFRERLKGKI
jgi:ankyrin repeat protein